MENKKMKLKGKRKQINKLKISILFTVFFLAFVFSYFFSMKNTSLINNDIFLNILLKSGNTHFLQQQEITSIVNNVVNYFTKIDFANPSSIINYNLSKYINDEQIVLEHNDDYSNMEQLEKISGYIVDPNPSSVDEPIIYLYNTHQLENYNNDNLAIYNITPNVLMASYILKEKLNKIGIATIVEETDLTDFLRINGWDYSSSYKASRLTLLEKQTKYPTIEYFIDIHRDSVSRDITTTNINDKSYAKILFVIGLEHDNYAKNLEQATILNSIIAETNQSLTRGIYEKSGVGVNGIYNQDISEKCFAIEIGGVDNTIEEVFNTLEVLANSIKTYLERRD